MDWFRRGVALHGHIQGECQVVIEFHGGDEDVSVLV